MDDTPAVGVVDRPRHRFRHLGRLERGQRGAAELLRQTAALDQFQREVGPTVLSAEFMNLDDVGVLQARHRPRLGLEAGQLFRAGETSGSHHLQGHEAPRPDLPRLEHDPHRPLAEHAQQLVAGDGPLAGEGFGGQRWQTVRIEAGNGGRRSARGQRAAGGAGGLGGAERAFGLLPSGVLAARQFPGVAPRAGLALRHRPPPFARGDG